MIPVIGGVALAGFAWYTFVNNPANSQTRNKAEVPGSAFDSLANADKFSNPIDSTSESAPKVDARRAQTGPARLFTLPPAARSAQSNAYVSVFPNGDFNPTGAPNQLRNYDEASAISADYHADHTVSIPFNQLGRTAPRLPQYHYRGRALGYTATVVPQRIGTVSFLGGKGRYNKAKHATDMAATAVSIHSGAAIANSLPALMVDPENPSSATSLLTTIKTGRTTKSVV